MRSCASSSGTGGCSARTRVSRGEWNEFSVKAQLARARREDHSELAARHQYPADARDEQGRRDHARPDRREQALAGHGRYPRQRQDRRASARRAGTRALCRERARMRWGEHLECVAESGPGDFIYVPPYVPHQEINASKTELLSCVLVRSGQDPVVVNLDIEPAEPPEEVYWVDSIHPHPTGGDR